MSVTTRNSSLAGIGTPTPSQQVAQLEYKCAQLNEMLGELVATIIVNLERGSLQCQDPSFREFVLVRSNIRAQLMDDISAFIATDESKL